MIPGYGGLSVSVEGPSKAEIKCVRAKDGLVNIAYKPTEPGIYILLIKFADVHVKGQFTFSTVLGVFFLFESSLSEIEKIFIFAGSPFTINCTGKGLGSVKKTAVKKVHKVNVSLKKCLLGQVR